MKKINMIYIILIIIATAIASGGSVYALKSKEIEKERSQWQKMSQEKIENEARYTAELKEKETKYKTGLNQSEAKYEAEFSECINYLNYERTVDKLASERDKKMTGVSTSIENHSVYLVNSLGKKTVIAEAIIPGPDELDERVGKRYFSDELSPNKKFVLLHAGGWEGEIIEVYDIMSNQLFPYASGYVEGDVKWLPDSKLEYKTTYADYQGISASISIDSSVPWITAPVIHAMEANHIKLQSGSLVR